MNRFFLSLFTLGLLITALGFSQDAKAQQCNPPNVVTCGDDSACEAAGCPNCYSCDLTQGICVPDNLKCDDNSECTEDLCLNVTFGAIALRGCFNISDALIPDPAERPDDLDIECYICEPTANGVVVNNGICDTGAGENCENAPECLVPGETCNLTPQPPSMNSCAIQPGDPPACSDGDRCTDDICTVMGLAAPIASCSNPPKACNPQISDGCCPAGCTGVDPANPTACQNDPNCDLDCWFPQSCGDGLVQPPETCDDAANLTDAGVNPQGGIVTDEQCRDPGTAGECTYCGDGIIQTAAGEECDGADDAACGGEGCNTDCTCNIPTGVCITGSGKFWTDIRPGCANCSLNPAATSQGWWLDYRAFLFLLGMLGIAFVVRRKIS